MNDGYERVKKREIRFSLIQLVFVFALRLGSKYLQRCTKNKHTNDKEQNRPNTPIVVASQVHFSHKSQCPGHSRRCQCIIQELRQTPERWWRRSRRYKHVGMTYSISCFSGFLFGTASFSFPDGSSIRDSSSSVFVLSHFDFVPDDHYHHARYNNSAHLVCTYSQVPRLGWSLGGVVDDALDCRMLR
jgi:hypothetical protein